ncbi:hypothetical protein MSPP1_003607 [Malassezia sp. CBS 17886]|nr:hypothetical protein MSPP1_003607 [Malassezia sp. CBS 17886]
MSADTSPSPEESGSYMSRLVERASQVIKQVAPSREGESRPLLHGQGQTRHYGAVPESEIPVPKPRPVKSPVKVEAKVWFANERTWISWLRASILIGTLALVLFNSASYYDSKSDEPPFEPGIPNGNRAAARTVRTFGIVYALISVLTLVWGLYNYQRRITLIKSRWPGTFDDLIGPPLICAVVFVAIVANFVVSVSRHM